MVITPLVNEGYNADDDLGRESQEGGAHPVPDTQKFPQVEKRGGERFVGCIQRREVDGPRVRGGHGLARRLGLAVYTWVSAEQVHGVHTW